MTYLVGPTASPLIQAMRGLWDAGPFVPLETYVFPDGEVRVHPVPLKPGSPCVLVWPWDRSPLSSWLYTLLSVLDALSQCDPHSFRVVVPYMPLSRSTQGFETFSRLVRSFPITSWLWVEGHTRAMQATWPHPCQDLGVASLWAQALGPLIQKGERVKVVAPDAGASHRAQGLADHWGCAWCMLPKQRIQGHVSYDPNTVCDVQDAVCVVVDDMIDSGETLSKAAHLLRAQGARSIHACMAHGVFSQGFPKVCASIPLVLTDTITPLSSFSWAKHADLGYISIAPTLIKTLKEYS